MAIPIIKEDPEISKNFWGVVEDCHFCRQPTKMWHENTNNPVCEVCSKIYKVSELPDHGKNIRKAKRKINHTRN